MLERSCWTHAERHRRGSSEQWLRDTAQHRVVFVCIEMQSGSANRWESIIGPIIHWDECESILETTLWSRLSDNRIFWLFVIYVQIAVVCIRFTFLLFPSPAPTWTSRFTTYQVTLITGVCLCCCCCSSDICATLCPLVQAHRHSHSISIVVRCFQSHLRLFTTPHRIEIRSWVHKELGQRHQLHGENDTC